MTGIALSPENRELLVKESILDPLILMARTENVEVLREVTAALCNLSSVPQNKAEIADRSISTILTLLLSGDPEVSSTKCIALLRANIWFEQSVDIRKPVVLLWRPLSCLSSYLPRVTTSSYHTEACEKVI